MAKRPGCFKTGCFGCLGITVLLALIVGINLLVAWSRLDDQQIQDRELHPTTVGIESTRPAGQETGAAVSGRVLLDLSQGEFYIHPAAEGDHLSVKARFDEKVFAMEETLSTPTDSTFIYEVKFYRTMPWLQALFRQLMSDDQDPVVHVYLPRDIYIDLGILIQEGGFEAELGGLWLSEADIVFQKGGFSLDVSEPLKEPLKRLKIRGSMGGFEADHLGNASPEFLEIDCRMGGAEVDLRGQWANDCDVNLSVRMGGMAVLVPDDVQVQGVPSIDPGPLTGKSEVPIPVLNFTMRQKMGEIEVIH